MEEAGLRLLADGLAFRLRSRKILEFRFSTSDRLTSSCYYLDKSTSIPYFSIPNIPSSLTSPLPYKYFSPNQNNKLPNPTLTTKCCPKLHAILYKYFGLNTVQINKCVLSTVQAPMTNTNAHVTNTVKSAKCLPSTPFSPLRAFKFNNMRFVAEAQNTGPVQFETKVRMPTARTL